MKPNKNPLENLDSWLNDYFKSSQDFDKTLDSVKTELKDFFQIITYNIMERPEIGRKQLADGFESLKVYLQRIKGFEKEQSISQSGIKVKSLIKEYLDDLGNLGEKAFRHSFYYMHGLLIDVENLPYQNNLAKVVIQKWRFYPNIKFEKVNSLIKELGDLKIEVEERAKIEPEETLKEILDKKEGYKLKASEYEVKTWERFKYGSYNMLFGMLSIDDSLPYGKFIEFGILKPEVKNRKTIIEGIEIPILETAFEIAAYYYYLQKAGYVKLFENTEGGKIKGIENLLETQPHLESLKSLQLKYNRFSNQVKKEFSSSEIKIIRGIYKRFEKYPEAINKAEEDIKKRK